MRFRFMVVPDIKSEPGRWIVFDRQKGLAVWTELDWDEALELREDLNDTLNPRGAADAFPPVKH